MQCNCYKEWKRVWFEGERSFLSDDQVVVEKKESFKKENGEEVDCESEVVVNKNEIEEEI